MLETLWFKLDLGYYFNQYLIKKYQRIHSIRRPLLFDLIDILLHSDDDLNQFDSTKSAETRILEGTAFNLVEMFHFIFKKSECVCVILVG